MKLTSVTGGTKLSGRYVNLENVGKVLRTGPGDRRKTDRKEIVTDSLMDWKPVKGMQKWENMLQF